MSSQIGNILKVSLFGESHGTAIGAVIDGFPPGVGIDMEKLLAFMARRAPGRDRTATPRRESDLPRILSGVLDGVTCGTPIAAVIENADQHSGDYKKMAAAARPGHADYTGYLRYRGNNDVRGGGHFSARLTAPLHFRRRSVSSVSGKKRNLYRGPSAVGTGCGGCGISGDGSDCGTGGCAGKKELSGPG